MNYKNSVDVAVCRGEIMLLVVLIKAFETHIFITILYTFDKSSNKLLITAVINWPLLFKTEIILR